MYGIGGDILKVKASLDWKNESENLPHDITLVIPQEKCNLTSWNDYIKDSLTTILETRVKVIYDIVED